MTLYPVAYGTQMVTMDRLREIHEPKMHPEFARRLFPYLEDRDGLMGIGGGWRSTQPPLPGFAPDGKSFHQTQQWASGFAGYAAVDLVCVNTASLLRRVFSLNGSKGNPDATPMSRALSVQAVHRAPTWAETADAPEWGLHTFIKSPPEPWHMQPIEIRGWQTWVNAGRPDPLYFGLPLPPPPPPEDDMAAVIKRVERSTATLTVAGNLCSWITNKQGDTVAALLASGLARDGRNEGDIPLAALAGLTLMGEVGGYSVEPGRDVEVTAGMFAGQVR